MYRYRPGQFCTFRVRVDDDEHFRCYSMSSAPETDPRSGRDGQARPRWHGLQLVQRPGGRRRPGRASPTSGTFCLTGRLDRPLRGVLRWQRHHPGPLRWPRARSPRPTAGPSPVRQPGAGLRHLRQTAPRPRAPMPAIGSRCAGTSTRPAVPPGRRRSSTWSAASPTPTSTSAVPARSWTWSRQDPARRRRGTRLDSHRAVRDPGSGRIPHRSTPRMRPAPAHDRAAAPRARRHEVAYHAGDTVLETARRAGLPAAVLV